VDGGVEGRRKGEERRRIEYVKEEGVGGGKCATNSNLGGGKLSSMGAQLLFFSFFQKFLSEN
jgi:hypothetical protein